MKNILITSAGRRVSLVRMFQQSAFSINKSIRVFTADQNPDMAPACRISDGSFKVPKIKSPEYISEILEICKTNGIGIIIPTIDTCLPIFSKCKKRLEDSGVHIIVSHQDFVDICCDKRKTFKFFKEHGIRCPELININSPKFPMFAKPYDGSSSNDIFKIETNDDLTTNVKNNKKLMFMEYIDKNEYKEFTIDMYYGRDNHVKCIVPRERIEVRGGEVSKGRTRKNHLVNFLIERFEFMPGVVGCICFQVFYREKDDDVVGIEINPRFGGGYPLTFHAGANYPKMILHEYLQNKQLNYFENWHDNILMLRYDEEVIVAPD